MSSPHPTDRPGLMRIPAPDAAALSLRFAPLSDRDHFSPVKWRTQALASSAAFPGWWEVDLDSLALSDGDYEYEFVLDGTSVPDPYAEEITRFGGYRGIFHIKGGVRRSIPFRWDDELPGGLPLPNNNEIVIYEMPLRWMYAGMGSELTRQMDMGTFDRCIFERLGTLAALGVNCIELLPVQDSPDTLNWGYGTRFFFAPDYDMGSAVDARVFVKSCHQRRIRVILDVVMNHAAHSCPLEALAAPWYFLARGDEEGDRNGWGGALFRYATPATDNYFAARGFHLEMAEYWVRECRVDGFRLDEFKSINNWDFVQEFRERAWQTHLALFPDRPFLVVAEDSNRRFQIARDGSDNPNGRRVVDSIWNFSFRDEGRSLLTDQIATAWGQPSRTDRVRSLLSGTRMWDGYGGGGFREGYGDMAQSVNYLTSHDVKDGMRLMNYLFGGMLQIRGLGDGSVQNIRSFLDRIAETPRAVQDTHAEALERVRSAFALLLTAVGIPMFVAGEEFADIHDLSYADDSKMSDPVDWNRMDSPGHRALWTQVGELIAERTSHSALQRNEIEFFYFHPEFDNNSGTRVFAYARTAGRPLGSRGQVAVIANMGHREFPVFVLPWAWGVQGVVEIGAPTEGSPLHADPARSEASLSLCPFQVRVFRFQ